MSSISHSVSKSVSSKKINLESVLYAPLRAFVLDNNGDIENNDGRFDLYAHGFVLCNPVINNKGVVWPSHRPG
jgi:hypothetical protein